MLTDSSHLITGHARLLRSSYV
ncbi:hypothetical protein AB3464_01330 [Pseudomonas asplenii]